MRYSVRILCRAALFAPILAAPLSAAETPAVQLDVLQGQILVDQGHGFGLATPGMELTSGNRLMVLKDAAGILSSTDTGCVMSLRQPGAFVVPDLTQCEAGKAAVLSSDIIIEPTNGVYEPVLLEPPPPPPMGAGGIAPVIAGGTFVAAIAATFVFSHVTNEEEELTPVSAY